MVSFKVVFPLVALTFSACDCGDPLQVLAPKIQIGDPFDATFSICATDFVQDCSYDFGEVGIGRSKRLSFLIQNPTQVPLEIESITLEGPATFAIDGVVPEVVGTTLGEIVTIAFSPVVESTETARVVIASDATNVLEPVVIELVATGKDLGGPVIVIDPAECNFGDVGVGAEGTCSLSIGNGGDTELEVTDLAFTPDTPSPAVFGPNGVFIVPSYIQPGTAQSVSFYGLPNLAAPITGTLLVSSNDPARPVVEVPFVIQGALAPTAVARVKSINGSPNSQANPPVEPLDNVVLSGDESTDSAGVRGNIVAYQWTLVSQPPESSVTLTTPDEVDTGFRFSSAAGQVNGLDVAGTFQISLRVTDVDGATSSNNAIVVLNAVPTEGLHIQLTWSSAENDLDLHLARGNNPPWCTDDDDCYFANCTEDSFNAPDWDGGGAGDIGDPTLDIDDLDGFGPENTNIQTAEDGVYVIGVHGYQIGQDTDLTVKIFVGGALVQELEGAMTETDEFWTVARVDVNGGTSVTPIDTMETNFFCF